MSPGVERRVLNLLAEEVPADRVEASNVYESLEGIALEIGDDYGT